MHERARLGAWLACLAAVAATRSDRLIGPLGADGVVLVPSRSVEDAHHEVVVRGGAAVGCSCWPSRRGEPCVHRMSVAARLWQNEIGIDVGEVSLVALAPALVAVYLEPRPGRRRPRLGPGAERDELPERRTA